jgi:DNA-binding MarR family transcriptional regulator
MHQFLTLYRHLRRYSRQMHGEGVSGRKISTLRYLFEAGPRTIGQLGKYLYISYSSTSELVKRLQEAGYVARARSSDDNRVVIVTLTASGRAMAQKTPLGGIPLLREKMKTLPPERLSLIKDALSDLIQLLEIDDAL